MDFKGLHDHDLNRAAIKAVYDSLPDDRTKVKATDLLGQNAPYDILWGDIKLCVRVANMSKKSRFPKWNYTVATAMGNGMVDFFILVALAGKKIYKIFVLPPEIVPKTTIVVTERLGDIRYKMFSTSLEDIGDKILSVLNDLPELKDLYRRAKP